MVSFSEGQVKCRLQNLLTKSSLVTHSTTEGCYSHSMCIAASHRSVEEECQCWRSVRNMTIFWALVMSNAVLTRQMKAVHPNLRPVWISHHQSHYLCARRQDDLKRRVVIWSVAVTKFGLLKEDPNVSLCQSIVVKLVLTGSRAPGVWCSYSLRAGS